MDVPTADDDIAEWPDVMRDGVDEQTGCEKCDEEGDGGEEQAPMRAIRNLLVKDAARFGEVQQDERDCCHESDEDEQNPRAKDMHASACITKEDVLL